MGRKSSRRHAFSIVYQIPFYKDCFDAQAVAEEYIASEGILSKDVEFIHELVDGVSTHMPEIDKLISEYAGWGFDRIATVDLAILRIAIFEIVYAGDTPVSVVINEAVELAKVYGTDDSSTFVNGLLARVVKDTKVSACVIETGK